MELLRMVKLNELDRTPCDISGLEMATPTLLRGMSPKKSHEVVRMTAYVKEMLRRPGLEGVKHVVDVGAGQVCTHPSCESVRWAERLILTGIPIACFVRRRFKCASDRWGRSTNRRRRETRSSVDSSLKEDPTPHRVTAAYSR